MSDSIETLEAKIEMLERSHNALIAKLEALAKEWSDCTYPQADDYQAGKEVAFNDFGEILLKLIEEAKQ